MFQQKSEANKIKLFTFNDKSVKKYTSIKEKKGG